MRISILICLTLAAIPPVSPQSPATPASEPLKDPRTMLAAALPQYNSGGTIMKPWHIKGTYQLYDASGNPTQQGIYEHWQESATVYRSAWTRTDATRIEWHTADGRTVYKATGDRLFYFEHKLETFLFSPVPDPAKLDPTGVELIKNQLELGKITLPCAEIKVRMGADSRTPMMPGAPTGNYCFDPSLPVLRIEHLFDSIYVQFDKLTRTQNRILAQEIIVTQGRNKILVFDVGIIDKFQDESATLIPPADATPVAVEERSSSSSQGLLATKVPPKYPPAAKASNISGVVILDAIIATNGTVKDIRVLETPSPLLTTAAKEAVARWHYEPFLADGHPQEVNTIIDVFTSLGY